MAKSSAETPLMKQYNAFKAKYPDAILLFRIGDFYETFGQDAIITSQTLGIVLTKRANGSASEIELAGFPHHSIDTYLPKLVKAGLRVAVCEQLEDPKFAKGIVKRGVTEIITPGITFSEKILEDARNNFLCCFYFTKNNQCSCSFIDISTGEFFYYSAEINKAEKLLYSYKPTEVLVSKSQTPAFKQLYGEDFYLYRIEDWAFEKLYATQKLIELFQIHNLKGFGLEEDEGATIASGVLIHYLNHNELKHLPHITRLYRFDDAECLSLDRFTIRNLELIFPLHPDGKSFFQTINYTLTSPGARLLKKWILFPLRDENRINKRLQKVETLLAHPEILQKSDPHLRAIGDPERAIAKLATKRLNPREASYLRNAILHFGKIYTLITDEWKDNPENDHPFIDFLQKQDSWQPAYDILNRYLTEEPPANIASGNVIRSEISNELAELRGIKNDVETYIDQVRQRESKRTGIASLKINFNKVTGFYIEITHVHKDKVPSDYIRKQTLTNCERFITPELKEFEEKILTAEERILALESRLFEQLLTELQVHIQDLQYHAARIARFDVLCSFAKGSLRHYYKRPSLNSGNIIRIIEGRHPVIETLLPRDVPYIPNDLYLDDKQQQIAIITGPNMAGKSALLRQTALIVLMAQMGSFVPAQEVEIGIVDKIFTRVGASDNISAGESTFMVEMNETARILNQATDKSLVLLDEIGRGTSTYDGVSIAWALVEYLHDSPNQQAKTLFATHYHELAELADKLPRVKIFNVSVKEVAGKILFMRKLQIGPAEKSFGIQVAEMAGIPESMVNRAKELLQHFEKQKTTTRDAAKRVQSPQLVAQMALFEFTETDEMSKKIKKMLDQIDINQLSPMEALLKLVELKNVSEENKR